MKRFVDQANEIGKPRDEVVDQTSEAPLDTDQIEPQGRDEMNLAEFPIAALTDYVPHGMNTIRFSDGTGSLMVTGSDAYGLPTATDADVVVALIQLTKRRNNFHEPTVRFNRTELLEILGWPDSGKSYKRLTESLLRWSTTSLRYEGTWWDNRSRRKMNAVFHILNEVVLVDRGEGGGTGGQPLSYFAWNKIFLASCQAGNLKRLDLQTYFTLEHASSKRLYRFLDKRLHQNPDQTFDLAEIAFERVGLSRTYVGKKGGLNIGKIREKLQPAIGELEERGFLRPLERDERYVKEGAVWSIRFVRERKENSGEWVEPTPVSSPGEASDTSGIAAAAASQASVTLSLSSSSMADELVARGVTKAKADELARKIPVERISIQVEVFDWKRTHDARGLTRNPAGWLVRSIEDGYELPKGFESREVRAAKAARQESAEALERSSRAEKRLRDRDKKVIDAYLTRLTPEARAALEAEALAGAVEEVRTQYASPGLTPSFRRTLLLGLVREHVAAKLQDQEPTLF